MCLVRFLTNRACRTSPLNTLQSFLSTLRVVVVDPVDLDLPTPGFLVETGHSGKLLEVA